MPGVIKVHMQCTRWAQPICGTYLMSADRALRLTKVFAEVTCKRCRRVHYAQDLEDVHLQEAKRQIHL